MASSSTASSSRISTLSEVVDMKPIERIGNPNSLEYEHKKNENDLCVGFTNSPNYDAYSERRNSQPSSTEPVPKHHFRKSSDACPKLTSSHPNMLIESTAKTDQEHDNRKMEVLSDSFLEHQLKTQQNELNLKRDSVPRLSESAPSFVSAMGKPHIVDASETSTREENIIFNDHSEGFLITIIPLLSLSTGLAALMRMPFLMLRHGGAIFLVPYTILILLVGLPMAYLEMALGQFSGAGIYRVWNCLPKFKGLSYSTVGLSFFISIYYNVLTSWSVLYIIYSLNSELPWMDYCSKDLVIPACQCLNLTNADSHVDDAIDCDKDFVNDTAWRRPYGSPQEYFFTHVLLKINDGLEVSGMGSVRWGLVGCCFTIWLIVLIWQLKRYVSLSKNMVVASIKAFSPLTVIIVLLIFGFTRPGVEAGMKYFFTSDGTVLLRSQIWFDAMSQVFFGLGATTGVLINTSSYRSFGNNCSRDSRLLVMFNYVMSVLAGVTAFAYLGASAQEYDLPLEKIVVNGPGAMIVIVSYAVSKMPSVAFSIIFFVFLTIIGAEQLKYYVETVKEFLAEKFPHYWRKWRIGILTFIITVAFMLSTLFTFDAGIYIFTVIDSYLVSWQCMTIGFLECVAMNWIYGGHRWAKDLEMMEQKKPSSIWVPMWKFVTPTILTFVLLFSLADYVPVRYNGKNISIIFDSSIWVLNIFLISIIPITYIKYTLRERRALNLNPFQDKDQDSTGDGEDGDGGSVLNKSVADYDESRSHINPWGVRLSRTYEKNIGYSSAPVIMVRIDPATNIPYGYFVPPGKTIIGPEPSMAENEAIIQNLKSFGRRKEISRLAANSDQGISKSSVAEPRLGSPASTAPK